MSHRCSKSEIKTVNAEQTLISDRKHPGPMVEPFPLPKAAFLTAFPALQDPTSLNNPAAMFLNVTVSARGAPQM